MKPPCKKGFAQTKMIKFVLPILEY